MSEIVLPDDPSFGPEVQVLLIADREPESLRFDIHMQGARETVFFSL